MLNNSKKDRWTNRLAALGIIIVVIALAVVVYIQGSSLSRQNKEYEAIEESLDAEIEEAKRYSAELKKDKVYVRTKEFVIEKAREAFGLNMPDEIIVRPGN